MRRNHYLLLLALFVGLTGFVVERSGTTGVQPSGDDPSFQSAKGVWADSVLASLTMEEKIAQLFVVAAYSDKGPRHKADIEHLVKSYNIGGILFFQGGPVRQAQLTNHYQSLAKTPIMISMDAEWGLAMRLDSTLKFTCTPKRCSCIATSLPI